MRFVFSSLPIINTILMAPDCEPITDPNPIIRMLMVVDSTASVCWNLFPIEFQRYFYLISWHARNKTAQQND